MAATLLGIPLPAHRDHGRVSGRYRVIAPEHRNGAILAVKVDLGASTLGDRTVQVVETGDGYRTFVDFDGVPIEERIIKWRVATYDEIRAFELERRLSRLADVVQLRGAARLSAMLEGIDPLERDETLVLVADVLTERGKDGLASAVDAYRERGS